MEDSPYLKAKPWICREWLADDMCALDRHIYSSVDGAVSVLYENDLALRRTLPPEKSHIPAFPSTPMPYSL